MKENWIYEDIEVKCEVDLAGKLAGSCKDWSDQINVLLEILNVFLRNEENDRLVVDCYKTM